MEKIPRGLTTLDRDHLERIGQPNPAKPITLDLDLD